MDFAKIKKKAFFLITIMYISQKYYIFAARFTKNGTKLLKIIHLNKQIYEKIISNRIVLRQMANSQNFRIKCTFR